MSLRFQIPERSSDDELLLTGGSPPRRKPTKRRVLDSDDGEDDAGVSASSSHSRSKRVRRPSQRVLDSMDAEIDIESHHVVDSRFLATTTTTTTTTASPEEIPSSSRATTSRKARPARPVKRPRVVKTSDEEDDFIDSNNGDFGEEPQASNSDEDDFSDEPAERNVKGKPTLRKGGKGSKPRQKAKPKAKAPSDTVMMKDERRSNQPRTNDPPPGTKRSRPKESGQDSTGIVDDTSNVPPTPAGVVETSQEPVKPPPPKKLKLPTIKKIKSAPGQGSSASSTPNKPPNQAKPSPNDPRSATSSSVRPAMYVGMADFDLRNPSVYSELFKNATGGTPRSGLNRKEKEEERLKELDKMRQEAKAKREAEAMNCFDLQEQVEKIYRFEEILHAKRSSALFPNCLGAKWRDEWELKRRREQAPEGTQV
ncbi:hypothetical protein ONZ45_g13476 [Pleurotus djamor]|nr:hypothetical protein ONZ45_g13476 [Pleurotus djamor]